MGIPMKTILLVEDNIKLNEGNRRALELKGYRALVAFTLGEARELLKTCDPDVILLDVMMPDGDGIDFCGEISGSVTSHILFLTAKTEEESLLKGLAYGGDDYITKPFKLKELLARVDAAVRRHERTPGSGETVSSGDLSLNTLSQRAFWRGVDLNLHTKEFALLKYLMQNRGAYTSTEELYRKLWDMHSMDLRVVKQCIYRLRKSFTDNGVYCSIVLKRGRGYRFMEKAQDS